jgi:tetratricopeptide (TPR) repeat protein
MIASQTIREEPVPDRPQPDAQDLTIEAGPPAEVTFAAGRYTVLRVLGEGGQKIVYLVHDNALERECALALLKVDIVDLAEMSRLSVEAQTIARLGAQRHVVTVYDIGEEHGRPFVVSEYVPGGDLRGELRAAGGPLSLERCLAIAIDVCDAMAVIHAGGIIHRDLKPSNIWLTKDGSAKLGDFGLAYAAADQTQLTIQGTMMGTAAYMPPEQALGQPSDARSDLYSFGCILYELVTGRAPFLSDDIVAVVSQHIHTPPVAPSWINPSVPPALERLIISLLGKSPAQRPPSAIAVRETLQAIVSAGSSGSVVTTRQNPLDQLADGVFVGREREIKELRASLENALAGTGGLLLLAGEAGIGKTRIAEELCTYGRLRGAQVLVGRCYEGEGAPSYWPWLQALRGYVQERSVTELIDQMGAGAADIAQIVPEVRDRIPDLPSPPALDPDQARFRLFDSIAGFLRNAGRRQPIVLLLDDLHWADESSLLMLQFLSRELQEMRVFVIATYRDLEIDREHPLTHTLAQLSRERGSERVHLGGLVRDDVGRFVQMTAGLVPPPALVNAVYRETEGNPFFVSEVVRLLVANGEMERAGADASWTPSIPQSVREVVGRRLGRLSEECNRILTVASIIGREFTLAALERLTDLSEDALLDVLEEALGARVVGEEPGQDVGCFRFSHALIRETLYDGLTKTRRVRLHRQIADVLEDLYGAKRDLHAAELAYHFFEARDFDKAVDYARRAGDRAIALLAYEDAVAHFQRALNALNMRQTHDDLLRCEVYLSLGDAQLKSGDIPAMRASFEDAGDLAARLNAPHQLARAALGLGSGEDDFIGRDEALVALLDQALAAMTGEDSTLKAMVQARLAPILLDFGKSAEGLSMSQQAVDTARRIGDGPTLVRALNARHEALWDPDDLDERLKIAREAVALADGIDDKVAAWYTHDWLLTDLLELGQLQEAGREVSTLLGLAEELRQPYWMALSKTTSATLSLAAARFEEAEGIIEETGVIGRRLGAASIEFYSDMQLFALRREQGRMAELSTLMERWMSDETNLGRVARLAAIRHMELGHDAEARRCFELLAADGFSALPRNNLWVDTLCNLADVCSFLDDGDRAVLLMQSLAPYADRCAVLGDVVCRGSVSRYLGMLATTTGRWDEADRHFEHALETDARIGAVISTASGHYEYGRSLLRRGDPAARARATEHLDAAVSAGDALKLTSLARKARAVRASGGA